MACALPRGLGASPWKPQGTMDAPNMLKTGFHAEHDVQKHPMSHLWLAVRGRGGRARLILTIHVINLEPIWVPMGRHESNVEQAVTTTATMAATCFVDQVVLFYGSWQCQLLPSTSNQDPEGIEAARSAAASGLRLASPSCQSPVLRPSWSTCLDLPRLA